MKKLSVVINSKIEVKWGDENFKSVVQDSNNKNLLISIPVMNGIYLSFKTGDEIEVVYYDDQANIYNFKCKIINRITENNISYYSTTLPYDITKVQRRNFVRVNTVQVIKDIKKHTDEGDINLTSALLLDLSGGGMRIKLKEKLIKDDIIVANISSESEEVILKGKVVRIEQTEDKRYIYGICFLDLNNRLREKIIKIVFSLMRKQRELR